MSSCSFVRHALSLLLRPDRSIFPGVQRHVVLLRSRKERRTWQKGWMLITSNYIKLLVGL